MLSWKPSSRTRTTKVVATASVAVLTAAAIAFGAPSGAGASLPQAQSVGNFLDGALGSNPVQELVNLQDASAVAPGTQSVQNPLNATLLGSLDLALTGTLQLPQLLGITLGAANQVAVAHDDGYSYGASGAVDNSGGVSVGGDNNAYPASATINLTPAGIAGNLGSLPGIGDSAAALGGVTLSVGAVSALAQTPAGVGKPGQASYNIAGLDIDAGSPLIGELVSTLGSGATGLLTDLAKLLDLPDSCPLSSGTLPNLSLEGGAITINSSTGELSINLNTLLTQLLGSKYNLNSLPPNTDLIDLLLSFITDPSGLAAGLVNVINGLFGTLETEFEACVPSEFRTAVAALFGATSDLGTLLDTIIGGLKSKVGGESLLAPIGTVLKKLVDIGINVQPNGPHGTYTDQLKATPKQTTPVVAGQTIVRAIEINLVNDPLATLALANAAAGPSAAAPATSTAPASSAPASAVPTGVPAGEGSRGGGGSPDLPLVLLISGLVLGVGGAAAYKIRVVRGH